MATEFLIERFAKLADRQAVISPAGECSFAELAEAIGRWTAALPARGASAASVVGLEGDFSPSAIALFLALAQNGAIVVPHRSGERTERGSQDALAQVGAQIRVDGNDEVQIERTARTARHELYDILRQRGHPGLVQFSSGTSGEPKAAVHDLALLLEKFETPRPPLKALAFLLFDHLGGINTMLHTLSNGATLVAPADRSPETVCRLIEQYGIELLPTTPTFLNLLLLSGAQKRHDIGSLTRISYGGEPMPAETLARLRDAFPAVTLQQTYGMVELGAMRTKSRADGSLWVKVGGEGWQTRVVDGMLQVRGVSLLLGYLNAPAPITADGWLETGDMAEQDGEYLRFLGRDTDLINVGGEKVYPAEVEGAIESMDGVAEATVYGEPNALVGQMVCARVTWCGSESDDMELARRVKRFCRERLERFKVPVKVTVSHGSPPAPGKRVKKTRPAKRGSGPLAPGRDR